MLLLLVSGSADILFFVLLLLLQLDFLLAFKTCTIEEIMAVFRRMDKNGDGHLDVDEMHDVATMLGENIPKSEIKEMIKMFLALITGWWQLKYLLFSPLSLGVS